VIYIYIVSRKTPFILFYFIVGSYSILDQNYPQLSVRVTMFPVILIELASIVTSGATVRCFIHGNHTTWMPNIEKWNFKSKEEMIRLFL